MVDRRGIATITSLPIPTRMRTRRKRTRSCTPTTGSVAVEGFSSTDLDRISDFACYPELRWLNRHYLLPLYGVGSLLILAGHLGWLRAGIDGVGAFLWGFSLPCFLSMNTTAMVNTLCHRPDLPFGYRRYDTNDLGQSPVGRAGHAWSRVAQRFTKSPARLQREGRICLVRDRLHVFRVARVGRRWPDTKPQEQRATGGSGGGWPREDIQDKCLKSNVSARFAHEMADYSATDLQNPTGE